MNVVGWVIIAYYCFGVVLLMLQMEKVKRISWNKEYYFFSGIKKTLVNLFEIAVWPYTLWRVYKLRMDDEMPKMMKCPKCSSPRLQELVLVSNPPQYEYFCPVCEWGLRYFNRKNSFIKLTNEEKYNPELEEELK